MIFFTHSIMWTQSVVHPEHDVRLGLKGRLKNVKLVECDKYTSLICMVFLPLQATSHKLYIFIACFIHVGSWAWVLAVPCWWGLRWLKQLSMAANARTTTIQWMLIQKHHWNPTIFSPINTAVRIQHMTL